MRKTDDELYNISLNYVLRHSNEQKQSIHVITYSHEMGYESILDDPKTSNMNKICIFAQFIWLAIIDLFKTEVLSWKNWATYLFLNISLICYAYFWINENDFETFNEIAKLVIAIIPLVHICRGIIKSMYITGMVGKPLVEEFLKMCITIGFASIFVNSMESIKNIVVIPNYTILLSIYNILIVLMGKLPTRLWQLLELRKREEVENNAS
jgi:hypothetical protein